MTPVTDLEEYRAARMELAADECATGAQLECTWTAAVVEWGDPTVAHLLELACVADDILEADSYEAMRAALLQVANGARRQAVRRAR